MGMAADERCLELQQFFELGILDEASIQGRVLDVVLWPGSCEHVVE